LTETDFIPAKIICIFASVNTSNDIIMKIMHFSALFVGLTSSILFVASSCCADVSKNGYDKINAQALAEYDIPIRCGNQGKMTFWNVFADKFIYAPAFDFDPVEGAVRYKFTIKYVDGIYHGPVYVRAGQSMPTVRELLDRMPDMSEGRIWSFVADSPKAPLTPVWADIEPGNVFLSVEALDADGNRIAYAGAREFLRDFPFHGPYPEAPRPYMEAERLAAFYIHTKPYTQYWLENGTPDPSFRHNSYACKTYGGFINLEVMLAGTNPEGADQFISIARKVADFLISLSQPEGHPLAHFPPTYYADYHRIAVRYSGQTMTMEPVAAANAFLGLSKACGDRKYYNEALEIARTYARIQAEDGSFPIKMYFDTGKPVNDAKASIAGLLMLWQTLSDEYGIKEFDGNIQLGEKWMYEEALPEFNLTGQFEDVNVIGLMPYQNLTNVTFASYARYLLCRHGRTDADIAIAKELIALAEDQFVHWDYLPTTEGFRIAVSPSVDEQYQYRTAIDASAANMILAYLAYYKVTGDRLAYAKAKALADACVIAQTPNTGRSNTHWEVRVDPLVDERLIWVNCTVAVMKAWEMMSELMEAEPS